MTVIRRGTARIETGSTEDTLGPYQAELISDTAGLTQFGAFIEELPPGSSSSHAHYHTTEDEMILILSGTATVTENGTETVLEPGDAACWRAGERTAHCMRNHANAPVRYVVIGTRAPGDVVTYPQHDRILHFDRATQTRRYTTLGGAPASKPT